MSSLLNANEKNSVFPYTNRGQYDFFDESIQHSSTTANMNFQDVGEQWDFTHDGKSTGSNPNINSVEYSKDYASHGNGTPGSSLAGGMAQQIELFDSSYGLNNNAYTSFSDYEADRNSRYSEEGNTSLLRSSLSKGNQYDIFDDNDNSTSLDVNLHDGIKAMNSSSYRESRNRTRGFSSGNGIYDSYDYSYNSPIVSSQMIDDLFDWIWGVIYNNNGRMRLSDLIAALQAGSLQWYNVLVSEFGELQHFLCQYPKIFILSRYYDILYVSLASQPYHSVVYSSQNHQTSKNYENMYMNESKNHSSQRYRMNHHIQAYSEISELDMNELITYIVSVLQEAPKCSLKAVELANDIRDHFGTNALSYIRETYSGLLSMLEKYPRYFLVSRIPKNDIVTLIKDNNGMMNDLLPSDKLHSSFSMNTEIRKGSQKANVVNDGNSKRPISRCLHVGNVGVKASEEDLYEEFGKFGEIEDVKIVHQGERRYAFVYFVKAEEAEMARSTLTKLSKWKGNISFAKKEKDASERKSKNSQPSRHLWLGNVNTQTITTVDLRSVFEQFGPIENINILYDKNCVFIDYYDEQAAINAQSQMKGMILGGNIIELGFGKYEEKQTNNSIILTENDSDDILYTFSTIMSKLRYREHISLHELYSQIISSAEFKNHHIENPALTGKLSSTQITKQNLDLLKRILLPSSSVYIIQEDTSNNQIFFSNSNSLQMKSAQDDESCIDVLKDMLQSRMNLISWPKYHLRDVYIINLTKQKLLEYDGQISIDTIALSIMKELFYSNKPINIHALEEFFSTYNSMFSYENGLIKLRKD